MKCSDRLLISLSLQRDRPYKECPYIEKLLHIAKESKRNFNKRLEFVGFFPFSFVRLYVSFSTGIGKISSYLEVVSARGANHNAIAHIKGVHHKQVDDSLQQVLQRVAEAEGKGQHQCGACQPSPVQVHLYSTQAACSV